MQSLLGRTGLKKIKLFDDARAGRISFDSPAYGATRTFMNGMIRYAHQTSLSSFVAFGFVMRGRHESVAKIAIHQRFEEATEADLAHCKPYFNQANMLLIQHLMSSPFMLVLIAPVWTFVLARVGVDLAATLVSRMRHQLIGIDEAALLTGAETRT